MYFETTIVDNSDLPTLKKKNRKRNAVSVDRDEDKSADSAVDSAAESAADSAAESAAKDESSSAEPASKKAKIDVHDDQPTTPAKISVKRKRKSSQSKVALFNCEITSLFIARIFWSRAIKRIIKCKNSHLY